MTSTKLVSIVCPVLNEEHSLGRFVDAIETCFSPLTEKHEIVFVDDGSTDETLGCIKALAEEFSAVKFVSLSRNFGKDAALTAGIEFSRGDAVIPMDVDLQDPPDLIPEMLRQWYAGNEVVLAKRRSRLSDSWPKRFTASLYYSLMKRVADKQLESNVGDFRLMDRKVVSAFLRLKERTRYMQGLLSWVGYDVAIVEFDRQPRKNGQTKFNFPGLLQHALDGITSFSVIPLRFWSVLGMFFALVGFVYGAYILLFTFVTGGDIPGYASLFTAVVFFGGVQLIGIGVLGEYIGRIYLETKHRPLYLIKESSRGDAPIPKHARDSR